MHSISLLSFSPSIKETITSEEIRRDSHQRIHQRKCSLFPRKRPHICKNFLNKSELAKRIKRIKKLKRTKIKYINVNINIIYVRYNVSS